MELQLSDLLGTVGLAFFMTLVAQYYKKWVPEDFVPHVTTAIAIVIAVVVSFILDRVTAQELATGVMVGFMAGAASSGFYKLQAPAGVLKAKE